MVDLNCDWCNKPFKKKGESYVKEHNFCCKECYYKWKSKYNVGENNKHYKRVQVPCTYCGEILNIRPSKLELQKSFYCDKTCKANWESENWKYDNNPNFKGGEFKNCIVCGEKFWSYNHKDESNKCCSEKCRLYYFNNVTSQTKEYSEMCRKNGAISHKKAKNKFTKPERIVLEYLDENSIEYIPQHVLLDKFIVDFYLPKLNTVIEVFGDYWHAHPDKYGEGKIPLGEKQIKNVNRDVIKIKSFEESDYNFHVLWERDIYKNVVECMNKINL